MPARIPIFLLIIGLSLSCNKKVDKDLSWLKDYQKIHLDYAKKFKIYKINNQAQILLDGDNYPFILAKDFKWIPPKLRHLHYIQTPIKNVLATSSTQVSKIRPLNSLNSILAVTTDIQNWHIEEIKNNITNKKCHFIGLNENTDFERMRKLNISLAIIYTDKHTPVKLVDKLNRMKIPYIVDNEFLETTILGRFEWIKFYGALLNKEKEAQQYFDNAILKLKENSNTINQLNAKKPKIAYGSIFKGVAYVPSEHSYVADMVRLAGGEYLKPMKSTAYGSVPLSLENFFMLIKKADYFIYSSSRMDKQTLIQTAPILKTANVYKQNKIWQIKEDWHQNLDKTHEQIIDLSKIIYPNLFQNKEIKFLKVLN